MIDDGQIFKTIRKSRNISQNEISKGELSRTTISKFENNKVTLSATNFHFLLDSLDISVEEFNYIKNDYSYKGKEEIIVLFNQLFSNADNYNIEKLIVLCEEYLKENYSKSVQCILNTLFALKHLNISENKLNCHSKIYVADVWNILSDIDSWTLLDLKIINCCLYFFEPNTYIHISDQVIKTLDKYKNFTNIIVLEISIYLNLTMLFLLENNLEYAKKFVKIALKKAYKSKRIDYIATASIRYGIIFNNESEIEKGLNLLNILDDDNLSIPIKKEIKLFKNNDLSHP